MRRMLLCGLAAASVAASTGGAVAQGSGSATPAAAKGEFGNTCAMGVAAGQQVATDCSVSWTAEDGKVYCFSTTASKDEFLKDSAGNIAKASKAYAEAKSAAPTVGGKVFTEEDAIAAMKAVVAERSKDGAFVFRDPKLDKDLHLVFDSVKGVRGMKGYGWFPNVIFHDKDEPKKQYAIDFWFKTEGDNLKLQDIRVQKGPKQDGDSYYMVTRLPVAWWWLPVSEHPGDMEVTRHWHVMSAIHKHIAETRKDGVYHLKDEKTGQTVPLEFVEIHQPVRRLKEDGKFFACTDFRKVGTKDEFYDVDFWLDKKSGEIKVGEVRMHKVPVQEDGIWTQELRYNIKDLNTEDVK